MSSLSNGKGNVFTLHIPETPNIAVNTLNNLKKSMGYKPSKDVVERVVFELSERLNTLEDHLMKGELNAAAKVASSLVAISKQIGMEVFADIACDLSDVIHRKDFVAIAAISRRLIRHGNEALFTVIDYAYDPISV